MTTAVPTHGEASHRLTRKGQDLPVRVLEVVGGAEYGHVLVFGDARPDCLVRVHSRCLYGEGLFSDDCDCGPELEIAMDLIQAAGSGVLIYLEQEGRGLGLLAKALGYQESERSGADTFASYEALGFPADGRTYGQAAQSLHTLGLMSVRLLTNNPEKVAELAATGIAVSQVPLVTPVRSEKARQYLEAKRLRRGHTFLPGQVLLASELRGTEPAAPAPRPLEPAGHASRLVTALVISSGTIALVSAGYAGAEAVIAVIGCLAIFSIRGWWQDGRHDFPPRNRRIRRHVATSAAPSGPLPPVQDEIFAPSV